MMCAALLAAPQVMAVEPGNANIYASGLKVLNGGEEIQFVLNAPGSVTINFYNGTELVHSLTQENLEKGTHTLSLAEVFPETVVPGTELTWEVVATGETKTDVVKFSDNTKEAQQFWSVTSIAVETNPKLETFGRVYVANAQVGNDQNDGIFILDTNLEDVTNQGKQAYSGNVSWQESTTSGEKAKSPFKLALDNEGNLFIGDGDVKNSGVYVMNTLKPTEDFQSLFQGTRENGLVTNNSSEYVHGRIWSLCFLENVEDKTLVTYDRDLFAKVRSTDSDYSASTLFSYKIGKQINAWTSKYTVVYTNTGRDKAGNIDGNCLGNIVADNYGGIWMSQNQATGGVWNPIIHVNSNGVLDCYTSDKWSDVLGIAINKDNSKLAVSKSANILLYDISYENGTPTLSDNYQTIETGAGSTLHALAFDVADNIYVGGTAKEFIEAYALPKADNSYTTPANEAITVSEGLVTGVESVVKDENAPVEYFNMQGVKVNAPENGIFIKHQGNKVSKVVL